MTIITKKYSSVQSIATTYFYEINQFDRGRISPPMICLTQSFSRLRGGGGTSQRIATMIETYLPTETRSVSKNRV